MIRVSCGNPYVKVVCTYIDVTVVISSVFVSPLVVLDTSEISQNDCSALLTYYCIDSHFANSNMDNLE